MDPSPLCSALTWVHDRVFGQQHGALHHKPSNPTALPDLRHTGTTGRHQAQAQAQAQRAGIRYRHRHRHNGQASGTGTGTGTGTAGRQAQVSISTRAGQGRQGRS